MKNGIPVDDMKEFITREGLATMITAVNIAAHAEKTNGNADSACEIVSLVREIDRLAAKSENCKGDGELGKVYEIFADKIRCFSRACRDAGASVR